ncbi:MAG TPA: glycosyltransferase family 4 protein [Patescibacteria group bacterium]|nr:glycosyltransferase family 4 protein [Patescibacteria group bacterium]
MKIFLICGKHPIKAKSGYASYAYSLAKNLCAQKHVVHIFCIDRQTKVQKTEIGTIHTIHSRFSSMVALLPLSILLANAIRKEDTTHVLLWGIGPWSLAGAFVKLASTLPPKLYSDYFTSVRHEDWGMVQGISRRDHGSFECLKTFFAFCTITQIYSLLERFLLSQSDKVITHYKSTENILNYEFAVSNFLRLPYSVSRDESNSNYKLQTTNYPTVLCVSRHDPRKGINFLLHAFTILQKQNIAFQGVLIGNGPLLSAHRKLAQKLALKNVSIVGSQENIEKYLRSASVFVLPSIEEGSGSLSVLEAMKYGLPIVATNIDGIPEDLHDNKTALLVPPKDPIALADGIEKLLVSRKLAKKLGTQAKKDYFARFSSTQMRLGLKGSRIFQNDIGT